MKLPKWSTLAVIAFIACILTVAGLTAYVVLWKLAQTQGAEHIHRVAEAHLNDRSPHAHFLKDYRYPDMFISRVEYDLGRSLSLAELEELLSPGSSRYEQQTPEGLEVTWEYRSYGIWMYLVTATYDQDGERKSYSAANRGVAWSVKPYALQRK